MRKFLYVDVKHNRRNDWYIAKDKTSVKPSVRYINSTKHAAKSVFLGVVGSDGKKAPPVWIDGNLDSSGFLKILKEVIMPWPYRT